VECENTFKELPVNENTLAIITNKSDSICQQILTVCVGAIVVLGIGYLIVVIYQHVLSFLRVFSLIQKGRRKVRQYKKEYAQYLTSEPLGVVQSIVAQEATAFTPMVDNIQSEIEAAILLGGEAWTLKPPVISKYIDLYSILTHKSITLRISRQYVHPSHPPLKFEFFVGEEDVTDIVNIPRPVYKYRFVSPTPCPTLEERAHALLKVKLEQEENERLKNILEDRIPF
jgi:hypothetical protein